MHLIIQNIALFPRGQTCGTHSCPDMFRRVVRVSSFVPRVLASRCNSTAPAVSVDWKMIRAAMPNEDAVNAVDDAQRKFAAALSGARAVGDAASIDWEAYAEKLPSVDVDAIKAEYERVLGLVPEIKYDEAADLTEHYQEVSDFEGVAAYARGRAGELREHEAEAEDHKLHDHYTVARAFQRFEGTFDEEYRRWARADFEPTLDRLSELNRNMTDEEAVEAAIRIGQGLGADEGAVSKAKAAAEDFVAEQ